MNLSKYQNLFNHSKRVKGCGNIKCSGIPVYNKRTKKQNSSKFKNYVRDYEHDTGFYIVDKYGTTITTSIPVENIFKLIPFIEKLSKNAFKCNKWFNVSLTPNYIIYNGRNIQYISKCLSTDDRKNFLSECDKEGDKKKIYLSKDATFKYYSLHGKCNSYELGKQMRNRKHSKEENVNVQLGNHPITKF